MQEKLKEELRTQEELRNSADYLVVVDRLTVVGGQRAEDGSCKDDDYMGSGPKTDHDDDDYELSSLFEKRLQNCERVQQWLGSQSNAYEGKHWGTKREGEYE